ncbi:MAG: hypothetical protein WAU04_11640, partial [Candidatus Nitrotoga sp.]
PKANPRWPRSKQQHWQHREGRRYKASVLVGEEEDLCHFAVCSINSSPALRVEASNSMYLGKSGYSEVG